MSLTTLATCTTGESAKLQGIDDEQLSIQLFCMGCIPGEIITIERIAPFGDPIMISVEDSFISIRKVDAEKMRIEKI
ncbi:MAG: ferrous iron transport protein A [Bacteroidetes bacterium]|nr:MAG: ferrous iron transport protein A [Bacteroidota bacterium]MBL1143362.1 ferrous iron transport protein A [Bacteroidota bacterium]MCB0802803.1 ferrous iron transport protein A [Flavobacteriales bacterium]NOG56165.1 ferrous iron transport protein A [Bacteroidota bacterium]